MIAFKTISRVTVYADGALEQHLIEQFLKLGVTGYTVLECRGKGKHELIHDPFQGVARVRIEMLVLPEIAEKLIAYLNQDGFKGRAVLACMETVHVGAEEVF